MLFTVAICTWNRERLLAQTLARLSEVARPTGGWEVLVVNNNCTDATSDVVRSFTGSLPIREIVEMRQGLSNARNAAVAAARGEYIVWTDDDVLVEPGWLTAYEDAVRRRPLAVVFGGPIRPWFESRPPRWLERSWDLVEIAFAARDLGSEEIPLDGVRVVPFGANFAVRRPEQLAHLFDPALGRSGRGGSLGEETAVIRAVLSEGGSGWWIPGAAVRHWVPKERQTKRYLRAYNRLVGRTRALEMNTDGQPLAFGRPRWAWRAWLAAEVALLRARMGRDERRCIVALCEATAARGFLSVRAGKTGTRR